MLFIQIKLLIFVIICAFLSLGCVSFKTNLPAVLLSSNLGLPSTHRLEVYETHDEDCFEWRTADTHILHVTPIYHKLFANCSRSAVVSAIGNPLARQILKVTAIRKGEINSELHWDVIIDSLHNIEFSWHTDELFSGGSPQILTVLGKDKFGHVFSSINGLHIQWTLTHESEEAAEFSGKKREVVRLKRYMDSKYKPVEDVGAMESRGMLGHSVLVEAVNVGLCKISASVMYLSSPVLSTPEVVFKVLPNVRIRPSDAVYLLRFSSMKYYLETINDGMTSEMDRGSFKVEVHDTSLIKISEDSLHFVAMEYGRTSAVYRSINNTFPNINMDLHIVKPASLAIRISNGGFTTLEQMKSYEINIDLFDENGNNIYPSDDLRLTVNFPGRLFYVFSSTLNGTYHLVQALVPGSGTVRAEFKGVVLSDGSVEKEDAVSGVIEVTICQKLEIFPPVTFLPSDSSIPLHEIYMKASGGTGQYTFASSNNATGALILDDENHNRVLVQIFGENDITITVTDSKNINFVANAKVSVQPVMDVEVYPTVLESEIGGTLIIPMALLGYEDREKKVIRKFDDCSMVEMTVEIIDQHVLAHDKESHIPAFGKGCASLQFRCKLPGHSRVNVIYEENKNGSRGGSVHKTTTVLACYKTLKSVHPVRVAVLALGTSKEIAFEGGPRKWPLFKTGHYTELESNQPNVLETELVRDPIRYNKDLTVFRVACKDLGETTLTFRIGNHPSATNMHPAKSETSIKVICGEPSSLYLKLARKAKKKIPDENVVKVPFYGNKQFEVDLWVKDSKGRKFSNISSFSIDWEVSDKSLAIPPEMDSGFSTHVNAVSGYRKVSRDFKEFKMFGGTGKLKVEAKLKGYRKDILTKRGISVFKELEEISNSLELKLISLRDVDHGLYNSDLGNENTCDGDTCKS